MAFANPTYRWSILRCSAHFGQSVVAGQETDYNTIIDQAMMATAQWLPGTVTIYCCSGVGKWQLELEQSILTLWS